MQENNKQTQNTIDAFLMGQGYRRTAQSGDGDIAIYLRQTELGVDMITLVDMVHKPGITQNYVDTVVSGVSDRIRLITHHEPKNLSLIIGERNAEGLAFCKQNPSCWYLDALDRKMYLYENQIQDFRGIRSPLENWINGKGIHIEQKPTMVNEQPKRSIPVWIIAAINIAMFILTWQKVLTNRELALDASSLFEHGQVYRLFTAMFTHGNFPHILYNMLVLFMVGGYVEKFYGSIKLTVGYLLAGVGGGLLSMLYSVKTGQLYASVGASGAIYGLFGMAVLYMIMHRKSFGGRIFYRVGMAFLCLLLSSVEATGTDVIAHIGGFATGFIVGAIFVFADYYLGKSGQAKEEGGQG